VDVCVRVRVCVQVCVCLYMCEYAPKPANLLSQSDVRSDIYTDKEALKFAGLSAYSLIDKEGLPVVVFFIYIFEKKAGVYGKVTYAPSFFFENMCMKRHVSYTYFCTCLSLQKGCRRFRGSDIVSVFDWPIERVKHRQTNFSKRGMVAFSFLSCKRAL